MTAIRSLIMQHAPDIDWRLIQVARGDKYLYREELTALGGPQVCTDHAGAAAAVAAVAAEKPSAWYYICGSGRFLQGMLELLKEAGVPTAQIRAESFNK